MSRAGVAQIVSRESSILFYMHRKYILVVISAMNHSGKEIQIILRLFLVIAMYCQASSINHSTSYVASWQGRKPRYMQQVAIH